MALEKYNEMRSFKETPEPEGKLAPARGELTFVIQKHDASHLHYDFRLEWEGVLKSWAVPKGPSLDPTVKRLAMPTEDHPKSYATFEGKIPEGHYGAGDVIVWDRGTYRADGAKTLAESRKLLAEQYAKGELKFTLFGEKVKGSWALVRTRPRPGSDRAQWLLIKHRDRYASEKDVTEKKKSVISGTLLPRDAGTRPAKEAPAKMARAKKASAKRALFPKDVKPMLATLVDEPFSREGWIFEYKFDGYRAIAEVRKGKVRLVSRNGKTFTQFGAVADALKGLEHDAVLDGEIVADVDGRESFQALQQAQERGADLRYAVFDLLWLDGVDLMSVPLLKRKELLAQLLQGLGDERIAFSAHVEKEGVREFAKAVKRGAEGIIAKRADSTYRPGTRSEDWLKMKARRRQEVVIGGFTEPRGSRKKFGALMVGVYEGGSFVYAGHVGSGFDEKSLADLHAKLAKITRKDSPFAVPPKPNMPVTWVSPKLVAEVAFAEWTDEGVMRQASFAGLRTDKAPKDVVREKEQHVTREAKVTPKKAAARPAMQFTHLDKILFPELKVTKGDLIAYYRDMAPIMLPYLKDRPENLLRHPDGIGKKGFFQKDFPEVPAFAKTLNIPSESANKDVNYLICDNVETLLWMAQLGTIEINPWNARISSLERPDYLVFDLDPGENTFEQVVRVAQELHKVLEEACLESFCKTSGKTGLHILVPIGAKYDHDTAKEFALMIMTIVHRRLPDITSLERSPAKRKKLIYLDYLQNRFGQTIVAPYSVRPVPEASVSTPLEWNEVTKRLNPAKFTMKNIGKRLAKKGDLWAKTLAKPADLKKAVACLRKMREA